MTRVRLFGAFRKYVGNDTHIVIDHSSEITVGEVKQLIGQALRKRNPQFEDDQLVLDSAIANDESIYSSHDLVVPGGEIAILPPVCGG
ncbi:MAG: hypothetical protein RJB66_401 [Pseudomonadota bacterium]|jgi:molybdopterin converting factor small subunit